MIWYIQRTSARGLSFLMVQLVACLIAISALAEPPPNGEQENARDTREAADEARRGNSGIWKAVVPPKGSTPGEFDGHDPVGLITGTKIKTDCSVNWVDPDSDKRYCFTTPTSLLYFIDWPASNIRQADSMWQKLKSVPGASSSRVSDGVERAK